jgi:hypothetical protein
VLAISQNVGDVTLLDIVGRQPPRRLCNVPGEQFAWRMEFVADGEELLLALADGRLQRRRVRDGALVAEVALDKEGAKTLAVDEPRDAVFVGGGPKRCTASTSARCGCGSAFTSASNSTPCGCPTIAGCCSAPVRPTPACWPGRPRRWSCTAGSTAWTVRARRWS